ncbi:hypothetical protein Goari_005516 [Gossypium aridum]|uniref:Uncharacterized protein n=1 Tax=Gossypium aridum TaxID=34290 RepID=A0A7J8YTI1_GOSAI|nr:hypothetical protein [Gossypium aridum]
MPDGPYYQQIFQALQEYKDDDKYEDEDTCKDIDNNSESSMDSAQLPHSNANS